MNKKQLRALKHEGFDGGDFASRSFELAEKCYDLYAKEAWRELENTMCKLRKENLHKYREVLADLEDYIWQGN